MRIKRSGRPGLSEQAREDIDAGRCWIGKFWGQTRIYVPPKISSQLSEDELKAIVTEFFAEDGLDSMDGIYFHSDCIQLELPSVLDPDGGEAQKETEKYQKPDKLVERIMEYVS